MAYIRKRGARWYAEVDMRGVKARVTRATKGEAKAWADATERQILEGKNPTTVGRTLRDAFEKYADEVSVKKKSVKHEQTRLAWLGRQHIASLLLSQCDAQPLAAWRDQRMKEVGASTVRRDFTLISHVFTIARREWKWVNSNPCSDVVRAPDAPSRKRRVSDTELGLLQAAAGGNVETIMCRVVLLFEFCIETACRGGEAIGITPAARHGDTVHLPATKNGSDRDVPLSNRAVAILDKVGGAFHLTDAQKDANFAKVRKRATLKDLHFHDSRHEAICRLAKVFDVLDLARVTGHRNVNELLTYYHADAHELAAKLRAGGSSPRT